MKKKRYFMVFYEDLALLNSTCNKQTLFFAEMISRMDDKQMVQMTGYARKEIIAAIGCSTPDALNLAKQYLRKLQSDGLIVGKGDGCYMVNPKIAGFTNAVNSINEKTELFIKLKYSGKNGREIEVGCND